MKKSRFSEDQIIGILKEQQAGLPVTRSADDTGSAMRRSTRGDRDKAGWRCRTPGA